MRRNRWIRWCVVRGVAPVCGLLLGGLAACVSPPDERHVVVRLADVAADERAASEVAFGRVGRETRHSLLALPRMAVRSPSEEVLEAAADGTVEVEVRCHPWVRGQALVTETRAVVTVGAADLEMFSPVQIDQVDCPADGAPVSILLKGQEPGARGSISVNGYLPPKDQYASPWLEVEKGDVLEFAIGLARPVEQGAARFQIEAEGRGGERASLFERHLDRAAPGAGVGWEEVSLSLDDARRQVGEDLRLHFRTTGVGSAARPAFPVWADPVVSRRVSATTGRPSNVILISLDTLRADRTGFDAHPYTLTPRLDHWARRGVVFERAVASANWTLPSHATMLTGTYPCVNGVADEVLSSLGRGNWRSLGVRPLARLLQDAGYRTAAFTENAYVSATVFHDGFEVFDEDRTTRAGDTGSIHATIERAERWVQRHAAEPFFLFLHTYEVHEPYAPSEAYAALHPVDSRPWPEDRAPGADAAAAAASYAAEIRKTDDAIADFLAWLEEEGLASRTLVVLTSDHGESFAEHGKWRGHGSTLFDDELHVPLVWVGPGTRPGTRIRGVTSIADVAPSILDVLGLDIPPWIQGRSALKSLRAGEEPARGRVVPSGSMRGAKSFTGDDWKMMYRRTDATAKGATMYDYRKDPLELRPAQSPVVSRLTQQYLDKHLASCEARRGGLVPPARDRAAEPTMPAPVDPERHRKLEALGYVE